MKDLDANVDGFLDEEEIHEAIERIAEITHPQGHDKEEL